MLKRKQPDSSHRVVKAGTLLIISHVPSDIMLFTNVLPKFTIYTSGKWYGQHLTFTSAVNVMWTFYMVKCETSLSQCSLYRDSLYFFHFRFLSAFLLSSDLFILTLPSDYIISKDNSNVNSQIKNFWKNLYLICSLFFDIWKSFFVFVNCKSFDIQIL